MIDKQNDETFSLMIVSNDRAEDLEECLGSVRRYVKDVIFVDTGCDDHALDVVKKHKCQIHSFEFCGDLSAARNFGLDKVEDDWILVMDGDEVLDESAAVKFIWLMKNRDHSAYMTEIYDLKAVARVPQVRFFKNDKKLRYRGAYGEVLDVIDGFEPDEDYFANSSAVIYNQRRHGRELETQIYEDRIKTYKRKLLGAPDDLFLLNRLGQDCEFIGKYKDAIDHYREVAEKDRAGIFPLAIRNLAICLEYQQKVDMALNVLSRGLRRFPDYTDLGFELGMILIKAGDPAGAIRAFKHCREINDAPIHYPSIPGTGGVLADFGIGLASELTGTVDDSALAFSAALDNIKENSLQLLYLGSVLKRMYQDDIAKKTFEMLAAADDPGVNRIREYLFAEKVD